MRRAMIITLWPLGIHLVQARLHEVVHHLLDRLLLLVFVLVALEEVVVRSGCLLRLALLRELGIGLLLYGHII